MAGQFKAVALTGPRQSGKTTLCRDQFPQLPYVSLENPDERGRAERDPRGFLGLCAGNIGQLFNAIRIGSDCGLNHGTVSKWFSILESSYVAFRLVPHHRNFRKRLVKTPKLYFWDTGLAIQLLGIETPAQLLTHPLRGALFENWVIVELMKLRLNQGKRPNLYFWRNNTGLEMDVLADYAGQLLPMEIKSGATLSSDWFTTMHRWTQLAGDTAIEPCLFLRRRDRIKRGRNPRPTLATPGHLPPALGNS